MIPSKKNKGWWLIPHPSSKKEVIKIMAVLRAKIVIAPGDLFYLEETEAKHSVSFRTNCLDEIKKWLDQELFELRITKHKLDIDIHISIEHFYKLRDKIFRLPLATGTNIYVYKPKRWDNKEKHFEVTLAERYRKYNVRDLNRMILFRKEIELVNYIIKTKISEKMAKGQSYDEAYDDAYKFATNAKLDTLIDIAYKNHMVGGDVWPRLRRENDFRITRVQDDD